MLDGKDGKLGKRKKRGQRWGSGKWRRGNYYGTKGQSKMKGIEGGEPRTHSGNKGKSTLHPDPSPRSKSEKRG